MPRIAGLSQMTEPFPGYEAGREPAAYAACGRRLQ
jgi:hypothetical protein